MLLLEHATVKPKGQAAVLACQACRYDDATPRVLHTQGAPPRDGPTQAEGRQDAEATLRVFHHSKAPQPPSTRGRTTYQRLIGCSRVADSARHP